MHDSTNKSNIIHKLWKTALWKTIITWNPTLVKTNLKLYASKTVSQNESLSINRFCPGLSQPCWMRSSLLLKQGIANTALSSNTTPGRKVASINDGGVYHIYCFTSTHFLHPYTRAWAVHKNRAACPRVLYRNMEKAFAKSTCGANLYNIYHGYGIQTYDDVRLGHFWEETVKDHKTEASYFSAYLDSLFLTYLDTLELSPV